MVVGVEAAWQGALACVGSKSPNQIESDLIQIHCRGAGSAPPPPPPPPLVVVVVCVHVCAQIRACVVIRVPSSCTFMIDYRHRAESDPSTCHFRPRLGGPLSVVVLLVCWWS